jgi:hypothetical protein
MIPGPEDDLNKYRHYSDAAQRDQYRQGGLQPKPQEANHLKRVVIVTMALVICSLLFIFQATPVDDAPSSS